MEKSAVIILNWNGSELLSACLQSLTKATGDFFVVVADNASNDDSLQRAAAYLQSKGTEYRIVEEGDENGVCVNSREVVLYRLKSNYGFAKGNNKAVSLAMQSSPGHILLLNNDTEVEPDFISKLESFSLAYPEYKVLTPLIHFHYDKSRIWNAGGRLATGFRKYYYANCRRNEIKEKVYIPISFVTGCALYFTPEILDADKKIFTERFFFGEEDFEFSLRMKKAKVKMACVLDSVIYHKVGSSISNKAAAGKFYIHYLNRFIDVRLNYGRSFYFIWLQLYKPYLKRILRKKGVYSLYANDLIRRICNDAIKKDSVSADDFSKALSLSWSGRTDGEKRILVLSDANNVHTRRWVMATVERGYKVILFSFNKKGLDYYADNENVECFALDILSSLKKLRTNGAIEKIKYLKALPDIKRCIKKYRPDLLHAHYASSYALLGALLNFHPYIISMWGSDIYSFPNVSPLHRAILKYNLSKGDKLLSTSNCMSNEAHKYTDKKIDITPFGIDAIPNIPETRNKNDEYIIGTVKALDNIYGIDLLIEAFSIVKKRICNKKIKLYIAGDGKERDNLEKLALRLGVSEYTVFLGRIPNTDVPKLLSSMNVFVALSRKESFGVAALEAMAYGVPVVTSDVDGFLEVVPDGKAGYLVPSEDAESAAEKIIYLLENIDVANEMGRNGKQYVAEKYSWKESVDIMMNIYNHVI